MTTRGRLWAGAGAGVGVALLGLASVTTGLAVAAPGPLILLARGLLLLACGALLYGGLSLLLGQPADGPISEKTERPGPMGAERPEYNGSALGGLACAMLAQGGAVLSQAIGAQRAWGAYWSWDPWECWYLAFWLGIVVATYVAWEYSWPGRRMHLVVWPVLGLGILVAIGVAPLLRWLGIGTVYG